MDLEEEDPLEDGELEPTPPASPVSESEYAELPEGIKIDAYMYMHGALVYKSYVQQIILNSI